MRFSVRQLMRYSPLFLLLSIWAALAYFVHTHAPELLAPVATVHGGCAIIQGIGLIMMFGSVSIAARMFVRRELPPQDFDPNAQPFYTPGLWMNRVGSLIPPVYTLWILWDKRNWGLWGYCITDAAVALGFAVYMTECAKFLGRLIIRSKSSPF